VAEEFLNGTDVVSGHQKVCRKRVSEGDVAEIEVDVLDSQSETLQGARSRLVEQRSNEADGGIEADNGFHKGK